MKRLLPLLALVATAAFAQTFTIPAQTVTVTIPAQTVTIPPPVVVVAPPPPPPPPVVTSAFWVYQNGTMNWGGDYSYALVVNYQDTTGASTGAFDIKATLTSAWGGFLPYAGGTVPQWNMDVSKYTKLTFDSKATVAGQKWNVYFVKVGDVALPSGCSAAVSATSVGVWETHVLTLSSMCVGAGLAGGTSIYKFAIQDQTGLAVNSWFLNNVGFLP